MHVSGSFRAFRLAATIAVVLAGAALPQPTAAGRPYLALDAGTIIDGSADIEAGDEHLSADFKSMEGTFDGSAGYDFGPVRLEARAGFTRMETDNLFGGSIDNNGSVQLWNATANVYLDLTLFDTLTLYTGGGAGAAYADMHDFATTNGNDVGFVWTLQSGVSYALTRHLAVGAAYRFLACATSATRVKSRASRPPKRTSTRISCWRRSSTHSRRRGRGCRSSSLAADPRAGDPNGIRTRVTTLKGWCPRPLDDGVGAALTYLPRPAKSRAAHAPPMRSVMRSLRARRPAPAGIPPTVRCNR